jgi:hypothetical protein
MQRATSCLRSDPPSRNAHQHDGPTSSSAAGSAQEEGELVTLLAGQRGRVLDHLLDVGVELVIVCVAVSLAWVVRGGRGGGHLGFWVAVGSWRRARASRKCASISADAREACACACVPVFTGRHPRGGPCARCHA